MNKKSYDEQDFTIINGAKGKFNNEYDLRKQFSSSTSLVGHASLPDYKNPFTNAARVDTVIKCGGSIGNLNGLLNSEKAQNRIVCAFVGLPGKEIFFFFFFFFLKNSKISDIIYINKNNYYNLFYYKK